MTTDRERFLLLLFAGPRLSGDVIVVYCGHDGEARAEVAAYLFGARAAPYVLLSGGIEDAERFGARQAYAKLLGLGVAPDRIALETESEHTRDQSLAVAKMAEERQWKRILLVASAYHMPRATLTLLHALDERGIADKVRIVPCPVPTTSTDHLETDLAKVDQYVEHVAPYSRGIEYLSTWETR